MVRKSRGRQKIQMVKMTKESNLQVTFSKRRFGLFKKASELVTLCGAEVALIVFSPGRKVYTFGHPSVETVIDRYLTGRPIQFDYSNPAHLADIQQRTIISVSLTDELNNKENLLAGEKRVGGTIGQKIEISPFYNRWWKPSVEEFSLRDLQLFEAALEGIKDVIDERRNELKVQQMNANTNQFMLDSGLFGLGANFGVPSFSGFNGILQFAGQEGDPMSSMVQQNLGALPGPGISSKFPGFGFDLGFRHRYF